MKTALKSPAMLPICNPSYLRIRLFIGAYNLTYNRILVPPYSDVFHLFTSHLNPSDIHKRLQHLASSRSRTDSSRFFAIQTWETPRCPVRFQPHGQGGAWLVGLQVKGVPCSQTVGGSFVGLEGEGMMQLATS